jgi:phenylacetate-CoA ligase
MTPHARGRRCLRMTVELSVIVPCFNEEGHLTELVERTQRVFARRGIAGEIVLVDDGSRDGTGAEVDRLAGAHANVVAVHHPENRGIPAGWKSGLAASRGRYVCTIDADLQYQPEAIGQLWREMAFSRVDLVQGWRSPLQRQRHVRYYMSRTLDHLLRLVFAMPHQDVKSGFVLYRREVLEEILEHAPRYFYFQTFVTVAARAKGYSIRQVETLFDERRVGRSFMSRVPLWVALRCLVDVVRAAGEFRLREPKEQALALALAARGDVPAPSRPRGWRAAYTRAYDALMPVHHWMISHNAPRYLDELRRTQWLPREAIEELQLRRLRRLVQHAYDHVGYYRELFETRGIDPRDLRSLDDLRRLPVLTKGALRENLFFDLLSDNHDKRKIQKISTSGSTGEPLALYVDRFQLDMRWANTARNVEWTGYRFPDRQVRLWHATIGLSRQQALKEHLDAWLSGRRFFPVFGLDDATIRRYLDYVRRTRPALLDGYAEAFNVIANVLGREPVDGLRAGAVISSAQTLPPETRARVEAAFGCRVFDKYGAREFSGIAHECEAHAGYHVNAESYLVEVMRDGRPAAEGEVGEVLVTDLNNRCVPLLRYQLGDLAVATREPCACGRGLPRIRRVIGRVQAVVRGTNGRYLPATFFAHFFKEYEYAVARYQVVQEAPDRIDVRIIRRPRFTRAIEEDIRRGLAEALGRETVLRFDFVDEIALGRTGKAQSCICRIPLPLFSAAEAQAWEDEEERREASQ